MSDEPRDELDESEDEDLEYDEGEGAAQEPAGPPEKPAAATRAAKPAAPSPRPAVQAAPPARQGRGGLALVIIILCVVAILVVYLFWQQRSKREAEQKRKENLATLATQLGTVSATIKAAEDLAAQGKLDEAKAKLSAAGDNLTSVASLANNQSETDVANQLNKVKGDVLAAQKTLDQAQADYEKAIAAAAEARNKAAADALRGIDSDLTVMGKSLTGGTEMPLTNPFPRGGGTEETGAGKAETTTEGTATQGTSTEPSATTTGEGTGATAEPSAGTQPAQPSSGTETTQPATGGETNQTAPATGETAPAAGTAPATGEQPSSPKTEGQAPAAPASPTPATGQ